MMCIEKRNLSVMNEELFTILCYTGCNRENNNVVKSAIKNV